MVVWHLSISLLVCLSRIFTNICTHILQKKYVPKFFCHPRITLGWLNPEFDFFTIPLSPLKMQKKFQNFLAPSVPWYTGSIFSQKNWSFNFLGSSGWHNPKIQVQIYPSILFSQEPAIGISKNFFPRKCVVKKIIFS